MSSSLIRPGHPTSPVSCVPESRSCRRQRVARRHQRRCQAERADVGERGHLVDDDPQRAPRRRAAAASSTSRRGRGGWASLRYAATSSATTSRCALVQRHPLGGVHDVVRGHPLEHHDLGAGLGAGRRGRLRGVRGGRRRTPPGWRTRRRRQNRPISRAGQVLERPRAPGGCRRGRSGRPRRRGPARAPRRARRPRGPGRTRGPPRRATASTSAASRRRRGSSHPETIASSTSCTE